MGQGFLPPRGDYGSLAGREIEGGAKPKRPHRPHRPHRPSQHRRAASLAEPSASSVARHHQRQPSLRSHLDIWLRTEKSIPNFFSEDNANEEAKESGTDGERYTQSSPIKLSISTMVADQNRAGMQYKSVDRGLGDSVVWHKRKAALLKRKMRKSTVNPLYWKRSAESIEENGESDLKFDARAVSRLQSERMFFDGILIVIIGVLMAVTALTVTKTANAILDKKLDMALELFKEQGLLAGMTLHVGFSALLAFGAFLPVAFCPASAGSGIAEAKATLNGVIIPNCSALLTALCKALSVTMSVAASVPAGLAGPMIHLGLCIGENVNRLVSSKFEVLDPLRSERCRIDYTAIGTAAGVAAAFLAPIAGILFAMEEGASYWSIHLTGRCFLGACVCVIAMYGLTSLTEPSTFRVTSMDLFNGIDPESHETFIIPAGFVPRFVLWEYYYFALVGCLGGLIGAAFCMLNRAIAIARRRVAMGMVLKGVEVVVLAVIYASVIWIAPSLPFLSKCSIVEERRMHKDNFRQFDCPEGQYNELSTLLLNICGKSVTLLFQEDDADAFSVTTCVAAGLIQLVALCICFGMSVSAGIFIPLLFIGACFGRAFGQVAGLDPRTYAIVGAAACLGGVVRTLISLTTVVTSTTSLSFFMTPIMVATICAQSVGNFVSGQPGIYDVILQLRDVPFLDEKCPEAAWHANIRARNIMKTDLVTLGTHINVADLVDILKTHSFSQFPVVDRDADGRGRNALVGSISRVDLFSLLSLWGTFDTNVEEGDVTSDKTLSFADVDSARPKLPLPEKEDIGKYLLPEDEKRTIHLSPYIQIAPHTFDGHGSAERAWDMFRCLGLRSLFVVDRKFRPIGVITRHELILLEEIGHDRQKIKKKVQEASLYTRMSGFQTRFE